MFNFNAAHQESAQISNLDSIIIEILRSDVCPDGNLPSTLFPGAGSDGALFQVIDSRSGFPDSATICDALSDWDGDTSLVEYDEKTGRGYFRLVDSDAPAQGTVLTLHEPATLDENDWAEVIPKWVNPYADYFDPIEELIKQMAQKAYLEIHKMCELAHQRIDGITLNLKF
uniref:Uncharacterized protein n=1 Tax=Pseudomonas fluorescens (strain SBW25) TaxID=216595 RepID=A0A0G4E3Y8_PSEFS|nr:hypothetical protein [Pseudomonas fluorescens]CEK41960.1 hypothetical protein PQBR57_0007 [Pseudomonas fluorescens SBW25]